MEKTLEEILLEQLEQPVRLKNGSVAENPRSVVTAALLYPLNRFGVKLEIRASEVCRITKLDCQEGKAIFGSGFLISERAEKERERAEKEEREKRAIMWQLSEREKAIVRSLG